MVLGRRPDPRSLRCWSDLRETYRAMTRSVERRLEETGLAFSQWLTLRLLGSGKISCVGDVNRELGLESGASTRLVDQLEQRGLLLRERSMVDRRVIELALTPSGGDLLAAIDPQITRYWSDRLSILTRVEQHELLDLLTRIRDDLIGDADSSGIGLGLK